MPLQIVLARKCFVLASSIATEDQRVVLMFLLKLSATGYRIGIGCFLRFVLEIRQSGYLTAFNSQNVGQLW